MPSWERKASSTQWKAEVFLNDRHTDIGIHRKLIASSPPFSVAVHENTQFQISTVCSFSWYVQHSYLIWAPNRWTNERHLTDELLFSTASMASRPQRPPLALGFTMQSPSTWRHAPPTTTMKGCTSACKYSDSLAPPHQDISELTLPCAQNLGLVQVALGGTWLTSLPSWSPTPCQVFLQLASQSTPFTRTLIPEALSRKGISGCILGSPSCLITEPRE